MSDKFFLDTNILIYAHDRSTGRKHEQARALVEELWHSGNGIISTQVLQEFCINIRRKAAVPLSLEETRRVLQDYLSWKVVTNRPESVVEALEIESRYQISFWDAMILQAAESGGATVLYSEDFSAGRQFGPVRVVNPFQEQ
jgi:predicted nucleic acid-binding protein